MDGAAAQGVGMQGTGMGGIDVGVFLPTMSAKEALPGDVVAAARHAESLGFESVWAVDQLVAGTGVPLVDSMVALSAVAGATERVKLGLGVVIVPIRPVAWIAKQVASMQIVSDGRVVLGVGVGGDRHDRSWAAAGVPRSERGARTDAALVVLPDLIAGKPVRLPDVDGAPVVELAPGAPVPPIVVGGTADAALACAVRHGDGWFAMPVPPAVAAPSADRLRRLAAESGSCRAGDHGERLGRARWRSGATRAGRDRATPCRSRRCVRHARRRDPVDPRQRGTGRRS